MERGRKWGVAAVFLVVVVLALIFVGREKQKSARYHLRKLRQAHAAYNAAMMGETSFRSERLIYTLGFRNPSEEVRKHERALLEMGYFRQTNFTLPGTNCVQQFLRRTRDAGFHDTNWSLTVEGTNVSLIAAAHDFEVWETITRESQETMGERESGL